MLSYGFRRCKQKNRRITLMMLLPHVNRKQKDNSDDVVTRCKRGTEG